MTAMTDSPSWRVIEGDCIEVMAAMDESSVDAIVTDPPYGLEFMGKEWDRLWVKVGNINQGQGFAQKPDFSPLRDVKNQRKMQEWHLAWATEALRVLKPGGHLLAFGGTRTYHRLACAIEDAGFEVRDCLAWLYGSGFPKSLDVSKQIDKAAGAEREVVGRTVTPFKVDAAAERGTSLEGSVNGDFSRQQTDDGYRYTEHTAPATSEAQHWQGWGTALKPAHEPIILARKPLSEKNVAANVLRWGTGGLNIDGTRIEYVNEEPPDLEHWKKTSGGWKNTSTAGVVPNDNSKGRWPSNVVLDEEAARLVDEQSGEQKSPSTYTRQANGYGWDGAIGEPAGKVSLNYGDTGGASRFFYTAKSSSAERNRGLEYAHDSTAERSSHPTVKPIDLMCWLVRLVTPPGGTVLDPFTGSGSTGIAALREGFSFIGIERESEYVEIARARIIGDGPLLNASAEVVA